MKRTSNNGLGTPFFFRTAWYVKVSGKREYLAEGTDSERELWKRGKRMADRCFKVRPEVTEALAQFHAFDQAETDGENMTVATLVDLYLADTENRNVGKPTLANYRCVLNSFKAAHGQDRLCDMRPSHIRKWSASQGSWNTSGQLRKCRKVVKQAFAWAVAERYITASPVASLSLAETPDTRREYLVSAADIEAVETHGSPQFVALFRCLIACGRRPGEVTGLRIKDIAQDASGYVFRVKGKNHKKRGRLETVMLTPQLQEFAAQRLAECDDPEAYVFQTVRGSKWSDRTMGQQMRAVRRKASLPDDFTLYCCRHYFLTMGMANGVSISWLAEQCGNSPATILKNYDQTDQLSTAHKMAMLQRATAPVEVGADVLPLAG